ncbi:MAG: TIGR03668 family PPOX class F420-dependent oxidoreductase [Candidatus Binatia bacterium]
MPLSDNERAFAERGRVAHLATADAAGTPHVIPICYALSGSCFYFVVDEKPKRSRRGLKRLRNIAENPRVALVIDEYDEDWGRLAFLLIHGHAAVVTDREEYTTVLDRLRSRYVQYHAMPLLLATHPMIRITPERHHMWRAVSGRETAPQE